MMRFWNLSRTGSGEDDLTLSVRGIIDGDPLDDEGTSSRELVAELIAHPNAKRITTRIDSVGGSLFGGIAVYNALQSHPATVVSIIEGTAQSAATVIAMAGRTVMRARTQLMIHAPSMRAVGDRRDLRRAADVLDKCRDGLVDIFQAKTGKSVEDLRALLDTETWFTPEEAFRNRFADEVAGAAPTNRAIARLHAEALEGKAVRAIAAGIASRRGCR